MTASARGPEDLGEVRFPSGAVILIDPDELDADTAAQLSALTETGSFELDDVPGVIVVGVPGDRPLRLRGRRMPKGAMDDRWSSLWIECVPDAEVVRSEPVGDVGADQHILL